MKIHPMKIRKAFTTMAALAGLVASGWATPAAAAEITLAHVLPPAHPTDRFILRPWSEEIAKRSGGALMVRIHPGGALGKGPVAQFERAVDGVADITFGSLAFISERFPRTGLIELPGMAIDAVDGVDKLWNVFDLLASEWRRVEVLALWVGERQILMTRNKPIREISDLKDMKLRVSSKAQGKSLVALGAAPVFMPINRVYNALNIGVIDGVLAGPSAIPRFKLDQVAKYYTEGLPLGRSPFFLVMNKRSFTKLSKTHRDLVDKTTGREMSVRASRFHMRAAKASLDKIRKSDRHEVITLTGLALREGVDRLERSRAREVAELEKKGVPARAILDAMGVAGS